MATLKQEKAMKIAVANGGNLSAAMLEAGYAPSVAHATEKLKKSKAWPELMEKYFPDNKLAILHKKLLDKKEIVVIGIGRGESEWEYTGQPHTDALKALETAYKLKGRNSDDNGGNKTLIINITGETAQRYGLLPK